MIIFVRSMHWEFVTYGIDPKWVFVLSGEITPFHHHLMWYVGLLWYTYKVDAYMYSKIKVHGARLFILGFTKTVLLK